jgi:hypothetical protein
LTLRNSISPDDIVKLFNGIEFLYPDLTEVSQIKRTIEKFPNSLDALIDAFSIGQLKSKKWLVSELESLDVDLGTIFICAGWYGTLASLLFKSLVKFEKIRSFDIDPSCAAIADNINRPNVMDGWKFKASTLDITKMQFPTVHTTFRADGSSLDLTEMPNTIINTSCEHIENFEVWYDKIPSGTILVLQSNNFHEIPEHVNCSNDIDDFDKKLPMTKTLYLGDMYLTKYTRFMKIGIK